MSNIALREVVAYYRVSTQLQGVHGLGMAAQREAVRLYGERNGYPIVAAYEEVETGRKTTSRIGRRLSRPSRTPADPERSWSSRGSIALHAASSSPRSSLQAASNS